MNGQTYTPPLGTGDTADYDRAIRRWTREMRWRSAMIEALAPRAGEMIVDVGSGTGSFAEMLKRAEPGVNLIGVDRSEEHTSELQSIMRISYAALPLKTKRTNN